MAKDEIPIERRSYVSGIDGVRQPYAVYLPKRLRRKRNRPKGPHPMVVMMHGFGGSEREGIDGFITGLCDRYGAVLLVPRGRGSVFYQGPGEADVLEVMDRTIGEFDVDPGRVFMIGGSMGGTAGVHFAARYPDRFAGVCASCGWADPIVWYAHWYGPAGRATSVHPAHRLLLAQAGSVALAANFKHVPTILMQGTRDKVVYADNWRRMYAALKKSGSPVAYREFARQGHKPFRNRWPRAFQVWFKGASFGSWIDRGKPGLRANSRPLKRNAQPEEITFYSPGIHHTKAYWLEILRDPMDPYSRVGATVFAEQSEIHVRLDGAPGVRLNLDAMPIDPKWGWQCILNRDRLCGHVSKGGHIVLMADGEFLSGKDAEPKPHPQAPRGPLVEAFRSPFLIVKPSKGPDVEEAERFIRHWTSWLIPHDDDGNPLGKPRAKKDIQITAADRKKYSLLCFGRPHENKELARVAKKLPFEIGADRIRIAGKTHRGVHVGLRAITRNPANPRRYLGVFIGPTGQRIKDNEAIGWYWPEYAVIDTRKKMRRTNHDDWAPFDRAVEAGEIDPDEMHPDTLPVRYLPDRWIAAGADDSLWR